MTNYQSASLCVPCTLFMYSFVYLLNRYNVTIIPTLEMKILMLRNPKGPPSDMGTDCQGQSQSWSHSILCCQDENKGCFEKFWS